MTKAYLLASVAAFGAALACPALAADLLPTRPAPPLPPMAQPSFPPVFTWSGGYVGLNVGAGLADRVLTTNVYDETGAFVAGETDRSSGAGVLGGAQAGFNYQFGPAVFGVETDFQGTGYNSRVESSVYDAGGFAASNGVNSSIDYYGTVRGRLGFAYDRALFYATGGFAYGRTVNTAYAYDNLGFGNASYTQVGRVRTGYAVGGGMEYAFTNSMSARAEYQYVDLGRSSVGGPFTTTRVNNTINVARVGLNYKFNGLNPIGGIGSGIGSTVGGAFASVPLVGGAFR